MDAYNRGTVIKIDEENYDLKQQFTEALVKNTIPNNIEKSYKSIPTTHNSPRKNIDYNSYNVGETCNDTIVKVEVDLVDGYYFESVIEVEKNRLLDVQTGNYDLDEMQLFVCDICKMTFSTKKKIAQHITHSHSAHLSTQKSTGKQVVKNTFIVGETCNDTIVKVEVDLVDGYYFESVIEVEKNRLLDVQTENYDLDEMQLFVCDICKMTFSTKKKIAQHITHSHSAHLSTQKSTGKQVVKNTFIGVYRTSNETNKKMNGIHVQPWTETGNCKQRASKCTNKSITKPLFQCNLCHKSYNTKKQITLHIIKSHKSSANNDSTRKPNTQHRNKYTADYTRNISRPYKCNVCCKSFLYNSVLTKHKRIHTGDKPYKCDMCLKSFSVKCNLINHIRVHTGERPHKCGVCSKSFPDASKLRLHERRVHTGEKPYKCVVCLKSFSDNSKLRLHERVHTGEKPYKCDICSKSFSRKSHVTQHKLLHTGEKPYKCDVCLRSFNQNSSLTMHKRIHTSDKPYKCDVCLKSFKHTETLTIHKRVHTGEKPYKCDICFKHFTQNSNLKSHKRRMHTGEVFYKCNICLKSFTQKSKITEHKRMHPVEKPYNCEVCLKSFSKKSTLTKHERVHTGEKPYKCDVCFKLFSESSNLRRHQRLHSEK